MHYFLHGGESSRKSEKNSNFSKKILHSTSKERIHILCVYFARPEHRWMESFYEDRTSFENESGDYSLYLELAEKDNFREQLIKSDVIFINGGFKGFLKDVLLSIKDFPILIENKIIVGISAGANILSKYYYSQGGEEIREGIGLLPIKVFCHFDEKYTKKLHLLSSYKENLPIYKIHEEEFIELHT